MFWCWPACQRGTTKTWERVTGEAANPVFAATSAGKARQVEADRKRKATDEAKSSRHASKYAKTNDNSLWARSDYSAMMTALECKRWTVFSLKPTSRARS